MTFHTIDDVLAKLKENPIEKKGHLYHPIPFQEFNSLQTSSNIDEAYKKLDLIITTSRNYFNKEIEELKILDIGANAGFYTFSFAKLGANVTAFEPHPRYGPLGSFIADHKKLPVRWYNTAFTRKSVKNEFFDVTLMLSVFQWMAGGGKKIEKAKKELNYISSISKTLIFELGYNKGASSIDTKKINHYAELIDFLEESTSYTSFKLLGKTKPWGSGKRFIVLCSFDDNWNDQVFLKLLRKIRV